MKIEEIKKDIKRKEQISKSTKICNYWFPLSKGYNRLLIVLGVIYAYYIAYSNQSLYAFIFVPFIEIVFYIAFIWIYRGFKESRKE
ncbi:hypothetical protein AALM74_16685 [Parabacteroides segnis]|uniref:hypothetical protein n=1 Tax=Parabacteroides segnis TaxID=2763058 RepID=UPI003517F6DA